MQVTYEKHIIKILTWIYLCFLSLLFSNFSCIENINSEYKSDINIKVPTPPQNLEVVLNKNNAILLWLTPLSNRGAQIYEYIIYKKSGYGNYTILGSTNSNTLYFIDSNSLNKYDYYSYTVCARNIKGQSKNSNEVEVFHMIDSSKKISEN